MSALSQALDRLRLGGMVILVDDEDRENEGDLVVAAEFATPEAVNFMATHGRGLICLALTGQQVDRLQLPAMTTSNRARRSTAFTVSIEAREGITTGISAHDRSRTILAATNPRAEAADVVSPGHIFPLRAAEGGVLVRNGHTEGAIDLMGLAGLQPAAAICEVMRDDGEMARRPDLELFAAQHDLPILPISDLVAYRCKTEVLVEQVASADLPSGFSGDSMRVHAFRSLLDGTEHLAMVKAPMTGTPLVRVHSECLTGDALGSLRCDCGAQLQESLRLIGESGGILIYLRGQEGRGIGLANKIRAYALQDKGRDTVEANTDLGFAADARDYAIAAQILRALGVVTITLLTNNPQKAETLRANGIDVREQQSLIIAPNPFNLRYLQTKREKLGHTLAHQN
ncbi:bifunctional 3,4-dihydroxy-2-butanone-4-phosphate synthase/GTP cyclohydrolase II [Devosia psychrophila]|uniref:Multifunctional fusion protein n=1 Tax=Devosia psychrophila TaxID=728005 RepID=A0A0F5PZK0_9HYPH|nr:bifunctional 3,4-dihydroxy-2-butanone-4-phosphate synthase/GTP cyclohydrolase II [Devosia psychrophila]KKC34063.1 3,4-dihydroxy-2-butanone 4-phosphate synthase [Devosia psychrophila]SFD31389.1 GTP cyclohydrolase II /3,4-dihydroxy-2-butanone 4-phosphate synthase [Devosia psychrophila]